jgi:hypothetical protein
MSNTSIRGSEVSIRVNIGGTPQAGTFLRVQEASVKMRTDIIEDDYLGESESELDLQHHGFDISLTCHEDDDAAIKFLNELTRREVAHERPQQVTITIITRYRNGKTRPQVETYSSVLLIQTEKTMGGRKERVPNMFEGKCKRRGNFAAA